jgi:C4-dicarboxylate-specific signal transduction histidine kinase
MIEDEKLLFETGLRFFGSVTASISHELKNALAVINENGGLLEDLALRAEKGIPIEPGRLKTMSARVTRQIKRTETIVENMNRFAHSADRWTDTFDLNEVAALSMAVAERLVAMEECTLQFEPSEEPVLIRSSPFYLEALLWQCLMFAAKNAGDARTLCLSIARSDKGGAVRLTGLACPQEEKKIGFPTGSAERLLSELNAGISIDGNTGILELLFPAGAAPSD